MLKETSRVGLVLTLLLVLTLCSPICLGLGLAPCEMRITNAQGSGVVGTLVVVNSDNDDRWITLQILKPSTKVSEKSFMRVICEGCHDSHQRYEVIPNYTPTVDEGKLTGVCPICGSSNLTFFEQPPLTILNNISLRGKNCVLINEGNGKYMINELLAYREERSIDIVFRMPRNTEYKGKHYEIHIMAASQPKEKQPGMGIVPGILMRVLIDTKPDNTVNLLTGFNTEYLTYIGLGLIGVIGGFFVIKKNKDRWKQKQKARKHIKFPSQPDTRWKLESGGHVNGSVYEPRVIENKKTTEKETVDEIRKHLDNIL